MKKVLLVVTAVAMAAVAQADFVVDVSCSWGIYKADGVTGLMAGGGNMAVEVYYVGDNGVFDTTAGAGVMGDVLPGGNGDDILLMSFNAPYNSAYGDFAPQPLVDNYLGTGEIFARVWNDADASVGGPWYYQSAILAAGDLDPGASPPPTPDSLDIGGGAAGQTATMGQVIPEPATIGLMGIAGLGMYIARRKVRS
jgi:hypothetical protein